MEPSRVSRRQALAHTGLVIGGAVIGGAVGRARASAGEPTSKPAKEGFRYCFNTATIRGQKLGIVREIEIAASAGYEAIEPWVEAVDAYAKSGGSLPDLKKRIADAGLTVESAISFPEWIVDDDDRRAKGLERAKREMELLAAIGGKRFAAPPAGATNLPKLDVFKAAERYRALLEAGDQVGVVPMLELWGFSQNMNRLGECAWVAMETGHPKACVLADVFHMYKGGSKFEGLGLLSANALQVFHMNDFPAEPPREKVNDGFRLYPGDGTAPFGEIIRLLRNAGGQQVLSLELFSQKYWAQDPLEVAKTGLAKLKAVVQSAG